MKSRKWGVPNYLKTLTKGATNAITTSINGVWNSAKSLPSFIVSIPKQIKNSVNSVRKLIPYLGTKNRGKQALAGLTTVSIVGIKTYMPILFRDMSSMIASDTKNKEEYGPHMLFICFIAPYAAAWAGQHVLYGLRGLIINSISGDVAQNINEETLRKVRQLSYSDYRQQNTAAIVTALNVTRNTTAALAHSVLTAGPQAIEIVLSTAFISYEYGAFYGAAEWSVLLGSMAYTYATTSFMLEEEKRAKELGEESDALADQIVRNYELNTIYNTWDEELQKYNKLFTKTSASMAARDRLSSITPTGQAVLLGATLATVLSNLAQTNLTMKDFNTINLCIMNFLNSLGGFGFAIENVRRSIAGLEESLDKLKITTEEHKHEIKNMFDDRIVPLSSIVIHPSQVPDTDTAIVLNDVNYNINYNNEDKKLLRNVSLEIKKGDWVGIVGTTGSGKSTIFKLLQLFDKANSGQILINGENINHFSQEELLSKLIAVAPPKTDPVIGTLYENLTYGSRNSDPELVKSLVNMVGLTNYVYTNKNRDVPIKNLNPSSGELQRIGIVRVLLRKEAAIFLLDEITSQLDPDTTKELLQKMKEYLKGKTVLLITHNLSTLKFCDTVLAVDQGKVKQYNTLSAFQKANSELYKEMEKGSKKETQEKQKAVSTVDSTETAVVEPSLLSRKK